MREIKFLGTFKKEGCSRSYGYSIFECPICGKHVEKIRKDGLRAKTCSRACYTIYRTGKKRGNYKEKTSDGKYILIYVPNHPFATGSRKLYVPEHRLIAEKKLGRYLKKGEIVHHINGDTTDNRPENLVVMTNSEHNSLHAKKRGRKANGQFTKISHLG